MLIAGGFVLGEVLALPDVASWVWVLACFVPGALYVWYLKGRSRILLLLFFFVMAILGYADMSAAVQAANGLTLPGAGETVRMEGIVSGVSAGKKGPVLTMKNNLVIWQDREYEIPCVMVYVEDEDGKSAQHEIKIGMKVAVRGTLDPFASARNPGEFDYLLYYRSLKVTCRMFAKEVEVLKSTSSPYLEFLRRAREYGSATLGKVALPQDAGIFRAAILGDKSTLDGEVRDLYQKNGIAHLLAISGLHLSIVGMGFYRLLRKLGVGFGLSGVAGTVLVISYGIMTGASSSVVRAVLMLLCGFLASYLGRTYDILSACCLALLLLAADSPWHLLQGGFQLSFGAIFSIGALAPRLEQWLEPSRPWQKSVIVSVSIQLLGAPIVLYHFYQFPVYGILLNFLVIPLMGFVICSGIGGIFLGSVFLLAGIAAVGIGHYVLLLYEWLCRWTAALPYYSLVLGQPDLKRICFYYSVLFVACITAGFWKKRGITWGGLVVLTAICFLLLFPRPAPGLEVTFLDVGQGDGIVMRTAKETILIDGGSTSEKELGRYRLEPYLKSQGIDQIDYAFVSHGDEDHISGLVYLLESCEEITISHVFLPCLGEGDEVDLKLKALVEKRGGTTHELKKGDRLTLGELTLTCLYPGKNDYAKDRNDQSQVIKADYGNFHMLLTGDMSQDGESEVIRAAAETGVNLEEIQVLKVAHHGSRTATGTPFLNALTPRWAVISYEAGNSYGHPHKEVVDRLQAHDTEIWRTAEYGAITMRTDGVEIEWNMFLAEPNR